MGNLLSAGMSRLKYSKLFYILLGLLVVTLTLCYIQAIPQTVSTRHVSPTEAVTHEEGYVTVEFEEQAPFYPLNSLFFQYVLLNLISCGVFCPLFLSHEYSDGVLRNKLIVGRNRTQIYQKCDSQRAVRRNGDGAGNFDRPLCGHADAEGLWRNRAFHFGHVRAVLPDNHLGLRLPIHDGGNDCSKPGGGRGPVHCACFWTLLFGPVFDHRTFPSRNCSRVACIWGPDGTFQMADPAPNPSYISGFKRQVYQFLYELTPGGQCFQIADIGARRRPGICRCTLACPPP